MTHLVNSVFQSLLQLFSYILTAAGIGEEELGAFLPTLVPLCLVSALVFAFLLVYFVIRTLYRFFND